MFFKNLSKKIDLIEQATRSENDLEKLEKKLKGLVDKEKSLKKKIVGKEKKIKQTKTIIAKLSEQDKEWNNEIKLIEMDLEDKQVSFNELRNEWKKLDEAERKLRKYFGDLL